MQFTPDLLPSDVVGITVWNRGDGSFDFRPGPVFNNVVLADEINRASPKTQAALLEAMAENQVTVDGVTYPLSQPFIVIATQNPIEHEGTYPLPESQLDRFLMRVSVGYPSPDAELEILETHGDHDAYRDIGPVIGNDEVIGLAAAAKGVHVAPSLKAYLVDLAHATRRSAHLALGISPRATLALLSGSPRPAPPRRAARYVIPDDVKALARPVLAHRLLVTPEAQLQGLSPARRPRRGAARRPRPRRALVPPCSPARGGWSCGGAWRWSPWPDCSASTSSTCSAPWPWGWWRSRCCTCG